MTTKRPQATPERQEELRRKAERIGGLGISEAAEYLGITISGVKYHVAAGHLHPHYLTARMRVFEVEDLDALRAHPHFRRRGPAAGARRAS